MIKANRTGGLLISLRWGWEKDGQELIYPDCRPLTWKKEKREGEAEQCGLRARIRKARQVGF